MSDRMRRVGLIHLIGIGGAGMGGIAEVLVNLGYAVQGSDLRANAVTARLQKMGVAHLHRPRRGAGQRLERRRGLVGGRGRESRTARGAGASHSGRAARRNAGRAHALQAGHRRCRNARQDDDHQPGRFRARRRRARPDVRDRRPAEERRQQREARHEPLPGRGGRRERRLVPAPATGHRDRHEHRQRPSRNPRRGLREAEAELRRVPAQPAVLRPCGPLQRRCDSPRDPVAGGTPDDPVRTWCGCGRPRGHRSSARADPRAS